MDLLRHPIRVAAAREPEPSMLMVDTQISKGDRSGVWFHSGHGKYRLTGVKRAIAVDYLGLPVAVAVAGARTHDVRAARELLARLVPTATRLVTVMGDRGFRGLAGPLRRDHDLQVVIKERPDRQRGEFTPIQPRGRMSTTAPTRTPDAPTEGRLGYHRGSARKHAPDGPPHHAAAEHRPHHRGRVGSGEHRPSSRHGYRRTKTVHGP
jgi:hypothetical protein